MRVALVDINTQLVQNIIIALSMNDQVEEGQRLVEIPLVPRLISAEEQLMIDQIRSDEEQLIIDLTANPDSEAQEHLQYLQNNRFQIPNALVPMSIQIGLTRWSEDNGFY